MAASAPSKISETKKIIFYDVNLTPQQILDKLKENGLESTLSTVSTIRSDFLNSMRVLKEIGALKDDVKSEPTPKPTKPKQQSRADRWSDAINDAQTGLNELISLQEEYQEWRDNLPENLQSSATGEKLQEIIDLDIQSVLDSIDEFDGVDLPAGFGRD